MKRYINKIVFPVVALVGISCSGDFLDPEVDRYLTQERKEELKAESPDAVALLVQGSLNGIYNNSVKSVTPDTGHDHFGLKAFHLATDLTGQDMVQQVHHWFGFDYNFGNRLADYRRVRTMWRFFYRQISAVNIIMQDYFEGEPSTELLKQKRAEARGIRGIAYYHLINLYQQTYKGNENAPGVPLVLLTTDENMPRVPVQKVYDQIIEDLTFSVENNVVTDDKKDVDKAVAAAYLAKTYAAMEDWANVEKYAKIASDAAPFTSSGDVESGKWDIGTPSWLWGFDISGTTTTLYASLYSHLDNTVDGYAGGLGIYKNIYSDLYDKIANTDVRKKIFINKDLFPAIADKYKNLPKYANIKFVTPGDFTGDYCFLRKEDPYLLMVEAYVEQNRLVEARTALKALMDNRDATYDDTKFTTQEALREEVRLQRRIELWGEGTSFFDLKRWKLGVDRKSPDGNNHRTQIVVPAGDPRWVYQIPKVEVEANPNLGAQNP
ncbi:RagB/SusD family nutrient uptake outer membrane protein [Capnocytophaga cynodegmi]|uniref:RagB/SusD family nutrient uptake outer membrane protein n=1 Tax=Capnocytophaga cynodegmi TaxID=28189 RepID=A0A250E8G8_9FLAO|nr:RagB/SusD family nutrient uptake outer membrane protein [Capnocytophaga cynodegmi]ATA68038.1 RagB/SusD family nutrient uptake outer membrane protein [Capnocytophaga cynodegmi]